MAIALDASSKKSQDASTTATWSHTCTGSNLILLVGVEVGAGNTITGVTYNGVSMSQVNLLALGGSTFGNVYVFKLVGPSTGANNIVVTASASTFIYCAATSFTGVDQTTPIDVNTTTSATATSITGTVTTTKDNDWLFGFVSKGDTLPDNPTLTAGTNTTIRQTDAFGWYASCDTNAAQTPAGSHSLTVSSSASGLFGMNVVAIMPVQPTPASSFLMFM